MSPPGRLSHFYVSADNDYVLAGSKVTISAAAVDTNYIPMDADFDLEADGGDLEGNVLTTPSRGGDITVTAYNRSGEGSAVVHAIETPDSIAVRDSSSNTVTSLTVNLGTTTALTASAV